jgi:DNA-binding NarL/FixJ family response regulator
MSIKVQIRHENPVIAIGLAAALTRAIGFAVVEADGTSVPDVVIGSYDAGMATVQAMAERGTPVEQRAPVLIVTANDRDRDIRSAMDAGVRGYMLLDCSVEELHHAVNQLARGARHLGAAVAQRLADNKLSGNLTGREADVLELLAEGLANKAIARHLDIGVGTVRTHVAAIMDKLGASTRTQAAALASRRGLVSQVAVS